MKPTYKVEAANLKDAAGIARVQVDTWRTTYQGIVPDAHLKSLSCEKHESTWARILAENRPRYHMWVAKDAQGQVIGFSDGGMNRDNSLALAGEIYAIYLRQEFHGQGVGKRLFLDSLEQLFRDGFTGMALWVLEESPTRRFYEAMGGKPVGEKWEEMGGKRLKEIAYGWPNIQETLRRLRPDRRHPSIKHYSEIQEDDLNNHYPGSDEHLSIGSPFAKAMGLKRLGIHHELLPPGRRTSWPHAEEGEEEFIYVIEGNPHVWIDGNIYPLEPGNGVAFPCGTGVCHTFINNTDTDVRLLVLGEASKKSGKIYYPLNLSRKDQVKDSWWGDVPARPLGSHDGKPAAFITSTKRIQKSHLIFYVKDQEKSTEFYQRVLGLQPTLNVPGMTEFTLPGSTVLGLMPEIGIKKLLGDGISDPAKAKGIPRAELYLRVNNPKLFFDNALSNGAKPLSPLQERDWGDLAAYCADPDGHVLAFAKEISADSVPCDFS